MFLFNAHFIYTEYTIYFGTWKYNCKSMDIANTSEFNLIQVII